MKRTNQSMFASTQKPAPTARPSFAEQQARATAAMRSTPTRPNVITPGTGQQPKPGSRR